MKICDESNDVEDKNLFKKIDELLIPGANHVTYPLSWIKI